MNHNEQEKQARRELAARLKHPAKDTGLPPHIVAAAGDVKVPMSLRERGREMKAAYDNGYWNGQIDAIKSVARLIRKHKFLSLLSDAEIEAACLEAAGLKQRAPRPAVTDQSANEGR